MKGFKFIGKIMLTKGIDIEWMKIVMNILKLLNEFEMIYVFIVISMDCFFEPFIFFKLL